MRESELEAYFGSRVRKLGCLNIKLSMRGAYGSAGWPDRLVIVPARKKVYGRDTPCHWFVELKTEKGRLTKKQKLRHDQLRYCGCQVVTLYGQDDVDTWIADLESCMDD